MVKLGLELLKEGSTVLRRGEGKSDAVNTSKDRTSTNPPWAQPNFKAAFTPQIILAIQDGSCFFLLSVFSFSGLSVTQNDHPALLSPTAPQTKLMESSKSI